MSKTSQVLLIYGPTATGKTALSIKLAKKYSGEIISADSRQVYKGLDIGTGKVSFDSQVERRQGYWIVDDVKIHGFDLVSPGQRFSVANFLRSANTSLFRINEVDKLPIVVGGTGFYIKALIDGIDSIGIPPNHQLRRQLEKLSVEELYEKLLGIDSFRANRMNPSDRANPRRLIRAIEIALHKRKHKTLTKDQRTKKHELKTMNYLLIGLTAPNYYLYKRADNWLNRRLQNGLVEEVKSLLAKKESPEWLESLGLEYRWLTRYLIGEIKKDEAVKRLQGDIHNFIRRQKTWFKQLKGIKLFDIRQPSWQDKLEKTVKDWYHTDSSGTGTTAKN